MPTGTSATSSLDFGSMTPTALAEIVDSPPEPEPKTEDSAKREHRGDAHSGHCGEHASAAPRACDPNVPHWWLESRVVPEDRLFEVLELSTRLEPEFRDERASCVLVCSERVGLTARAVEREHQPGAKAPPGADAA